MPTKLSIQGMHCESCGQLITMELADAGFRNNIVSIDLLKNNTGELALKDVSDDDLVKIKKLINQLGSYSV
jgi:copper chaperone CopZ